MCDELTVQDNEKFFKESGTLTRRQFNTLAAGAALSMMLPPVANAVEVDGRDVNVTTPDGTADCYFVHPRASKSPGVLIWPHCDIRKIWRKKKSKSPNPPICQAFILSATMR